MANDLFPFNFDPFIDFASFREAVRQMMESGWVLPRDLMPTAMASVMIPLDIIDTGPEIVVQSNLPGVKPEDVSITVIGTTLTIKGGAPNIEQFEGAQYIRRERRSLSFVRSVNLPVDVDSEHGEAKFQNGVLTLTLPKAEAVRPKTIKITTVE